MLKNKEIDLKEEERKLKLMQENESKSRLFRISNKKPPIAMTARNRPEFKTVIKIYPEFNPKLSRNCMRPVSVKAWETARTLAATPILSDKIEDSPDNDMPDGFSLPSNWKSSKPKPRTAAHGSRIEKCKTMSNLFQQKPRTSSAQRSRNTMRLKSLTKDGVPKFGSTFSSNCFKGAMSSINFQTARKYEMEIMDLQKEINDTKAMTRECNQDLNKVREERRFTKGLLQQLANEIRNQMNAKIKTYKHSKGSKTMRKLIPTWNLQYEDQYKQTEESDPVLNQMLEGKEKYDELVPIKLIESKERIIRLIMSKSGLFKNDLQVQP